MKEYVQALQAIFRAFRGEEKLSFEGDYYSVFFVATTVVTGTDRSRRSADLRLRGAGLDVAYGG